MPLFPLLCLLQSLHPLLLAQVVFQFSRTAICIPKVNVLLLVLLDVGLDVFRNLGHRHELLLDLRSQLIDLVKFEAYLVHLHLGAERATRIPAFHLNRRSKAATIGLARID